RLEQLPVAAAGHFPGDDEDHAGRHRRLCAGGRHPDAARRVQRVDGRRDPAQPAEPAAVLLPAEILHPGHRLERGQGLVGDWRPGGLRSAFLSEPPFCYRTPDDAVTGCDVELARHVARQIGADAFELIETRFAELLPGLIDGRWNMTTGLFVTEERRRL